jgi:hypothetical protein
MNCRAVPRLLLAGASLCALPAVFAQATPGSAPSAAGTPKQDLYLTSEWRASLSAEFTYAGAPRSASASTPSAALAADPGVPALPAFIVVESPTGPGPAPQPVEPPPKTVAQKLGFGEHTVAMKHVQLKYVTALYIPFLVQLAW